MLCFKLLSFQINCVPYHGSISCGFQDETINHYFLYCPRFAALRQILVPSVAQYFNNTWRHMSHSQKVNILLFRSSQLSFQENIVIFYHYKNVKSFLMTLHFVFDALNVQLLSSLRCYPI